MVLKVVISDKGPFFGVRHVQSLLLFLYLVFNYSSHLNISVLLVSMTNSATTNPDFPEYDWNEIQKSYILSSFYWGCVFTIFISSYVCHHFGVKFTITISSLGSSILNIITPLCIPYGGWEIFCAIRLLQGIFKGIAQPAVHKHIANWSPVEERTHLGAFVLLGKGAGTIVSIALPGLIAHSSLGWPGISYVFGGLGLLLTVVWLLFAADSPNSSKYISLEEKTYILTSQQTFGNQNVNCSIPWKKIITSCPFISLVIVRMAQNWGYFTLQMQIVSYFHGVLKINIKKNTVYSTLPFVTAFVLSFVFLFVADHLTKTNILSLTALRKTFNSISMWIPAAALIGIGFLSERLQHFATVLMIIAIGFNAGETIGSALNAIDLSPNYTAVLIDILSAGITVANIISPLLVGVIVHDETNRSQWQNVFLLSALILFFGNLQYIIFGTAELQAWDSEKYLRESSNEIELKSENSNQIKY